ncbi:mobile element protein [Novosphingobium sp. MD-1]|nr:mobile element protein [Novosphingobium sp. MD-1]
MHPVTDAKGRPFSFFITAGQHSDYAGAAASLDDLPKAKWMLAGRGYDADWFGDALGLPSNLAFRGENPDFCPSNTTRG